MTRRNMDIRPPALGPLVRFSARQLAWPALVIPLAAPALLAAYAKLLAPLPDKDYPEAAALGILAIAVAVAALRWALQRQAYWLWLTCFAASLLFREIHIDNTSVGADVIALCLLLYAWRYYPRFAGFLASRMTLTLLASALLCYTVTVSMDHGMFDSLVTDFFLPFLVEEYIEDLGHSYILLMSLLSRNVYNPLIEKTD